MTEEQKNIIHHIFCIETFWTNEIASQWQNDGRIGKELKGLTTEEIYNEGVRFAQEMNKKIGHQVY